MVDRLQITLLATSDLITCRFLIIPETCCFLPFGKLPPYVGILLLHPCPLAAYLTFFFSFFLYRSIGMEKPELYLSIGKLPLFSYSLIQ